MHRDTHHDGRRSARSATSVIVGSFVLLTLSAGPFAALARGQTATPVAPATPSLYARLGGYDGIAGFVDTAFPRVAGHPQLRRLFQGHSQDSQLRQRQLIVDMLCRATGGPCVYIGRPMKPVHTGLGITDADWTTFIGIIRSALAERHVAERERAELLRVFEEQFRPTVVEQR